LIKNGFRKFILLNNNGGNMSLAIRAPKMEPSAPSPCGGDTAPYALPSRKDKQRELDAAADAACNTFFDLNWKMGELVFTLAGRIPSHLNYQQREAYLHTMEEYVTATRKLEAARARFNAASAAAAEFKALP